MTDPVEALGIIGPTFGINTNFHGTLIQIAHQGQAPTSNEPGFRLLRFANTHREMLIAKRMLLQKIPNTGNILYQKKDAATLICKDLERQQNAEYILPKITALKQSYLDYIQFTDKDYAENRRLRREGDQEKAKEQSDKYITTYNTKGWVKFMRKEHNIHPDVVIIPGMHAEAEVQSQHLRTTKKDSSELTLAEKPSPESLPVEPAVAPTTKPSIKTEVDLKPKEGKGKALEDIEEEEEDNIDDVPDEVEEPDFPAGAKAKGQRYAAVSTIVDDSEDMEVLLFIHAFYPDAKSAKAHVSNELNNILHPLPVDVVDMYEWIFPVRMLWDNSKLSTRVTDLEETWTDLKLKEKQEDRERATHESRALKQEALKKKEMDLAVVQQLCERLNITAPQVTTIMDDPQLGAEAVIQVCKIENTDERHQQAAALLQKVATVVFL